MRALLLAAALLLPEPARALDPWEAHDTVTEAAVLTLIAVDWMQTTSFRAEGVEETNPVLGRRPSRARVNVLIGAAMVGHVVAARLLPDEGDYVNWRHAFQFVTVAIEAGYVTNNWAMGIGLKFPF